MKWAAIAFLFVCESAFAQSAELSDKQVTAWNNVQYEITQCAAFWYAFRACMPDSATPDQARQATLVAQHFTELAVAIGIKIGMTQDAMNSRLKMVMEDQGKLIEGKCVNMSSLATRYLARCKSLGEHPEAAFHDYMKR